MPSESATSAACSGPAPPNATSANSRGSWPFSIVRERIAPRHVRVRDREDPLGRLGGGSPSCSASRPTTSTGGVAVERHPAAEEALGVEPAEHDVRVADRRLLAAVPVAGRAGIGARAARADAERAALVDVRDRAAAGADRVHVEHRHEQRVAADPRVARRGLGDPALGDDPDVGRRAAHVERDHAACARRARPAHCPPRIPAAGPGEQQRHGPLGRGMLAGDAAARHHHVQLAVDALLRRAPAARRSR